MCDSNSDDDGDDRWSQGRRRRKQRDGRQSIRETQGAKQPVSACQCESVGSVLGGRAGACDAMRCDTGRCDAAAGGLLAMRFAMQRYDAAVRSGDR